MFTFSKLPIAETIVQKNIKFRMPLNGGMRKTFSIKEYNLKNDH